MIQIHNKKDCSGCSACANICPKNCIKMERDEMGFVYPKVDADVCINCGRCETVCPILSPAKENSPLAVIGAKNRDESVRSTSSSGGTFFELAKEIISRGGIVYGCALDSELVARHIGVETAEDLSNLKGSKYVQSDVGTTYREVKKYLMDGREVLYSGTPCQIAGLKNYLGKSYDNLLLVDVLCHGVPSPGVFADYLDYLSERFGAKPISVNFRNKEKSWKRLYFEVKFDNGKRYFTFCGYDRYMSMFLNNISLRPSCYDCRFTTVNRQGDITLGDFWGIGRKYPERDDDKGISLIIVNSEKGKNAYESISGKFDAFDSDIDTAKAGQLILSSSVKKHASYDEFFRLYTEQGIEKAAKTTVYIPGKLKRRYEMSKRWALDLARKILKKGY
ncbi:MAG: Coenzyme F420 hydrogenase/dehydrogenase, beta subunit C-terminal domain [Clostridia bacterium]|nr:Coenzyme F420 hydrogenase/dehydrogenase, beta subunit C-terminal domain [Clostridia bacterium]